MSPESTIIINVLLRVFISSHITSSTHGALNNDVSAPFNIIYAYITPISALLYSDSHLIIRAFHTRVGIRAIYSQNPALSSKRNIHLRAFVIDAYTYYTYIILVYVHNVHFHKILIFLRKNHVCQARFSCRYTARNTHGLHNIL